MAIRPIPSDLHSAIALRAAQGLLGLGASSMARIVTGLWNLTVYHRSMAVAYI